MSLPSNDDDGIDVLIPGHFLIRKQFQIIPSPTVLTLYFIGGTMSSIGMSFLEAVVDRVPVNLCKFIKWHNHNRNLEVDDVVILSEDNTVPTKCGLWQE